MMIFALFVLATGQPQIKIAYVDLAVNDAYVYVSTQDLGGNRIRVWAGNLSDERGTSPLVLPNLEPGSHAIYAAIVDAAGTQLVKTSPYYIDVAQLTSQIPLAVLNSPQPVSSDHLLIAVSGMPELPLLWRVELALDSSFRNETLRYDYPASQTLLNVPFGPDVWPGAGVAWARVRAIYQLGESPWSAPMGFSYSHLPVYTYILPHVPNMEGADPWRAWLYFEVPTQASAGPVEITATYPSVNRFGQREIQRDTWQAAEFGSRTEIELELSDRAPMVFTSSVPLAVSARFERWGKGAPIQLPHHRGAKRWQASGLKNDLNAGALAALVVANHSENEWVAIGVRMTLSADSHLIDLGEIERILDPMSSTIVTLPDGAAGTITGYVDATGAVSTLVAQFNECGGWIPSYTLAVPTEAAQ